MVTVTTPGAAPEAQCDIPNRRTIRLPGASPAELVQAMRREPPPEGGVEPVTAAQFVERFARAYGQEMTVRKRQSRRSTPR
jgi:hypothetical protein